MPKATAKVGFHADIPARFREDGASVSSGRLVNPPIPVPFNSSI